MEQGDDNSKWGRTGCGIMFVLAIAVPFYFLGGPLLLAGILILGGFGYFLWVYNATHPKDSDREDPPS